MKLINITRNTKKKGGNNDKEKFYTGQRLDLMEKGKSWYVQPDKESSLSSSFQSLSQNQMKDYYTHKKNKEEYRLREKEGLTFGGKTRRRRRRTSRIRHRSNKHTKRRYRR